MFWWRNKKNNQELSPNTPLCSSFVYWETYTFLTSGPPEAPTKLKFSDVTSDSVRLHWVSGYDMGSKQHFVVLKYIGGSFIQVRVHPVRSKNTSLIIWTAPRENVSFGICEQWRPWSDCASAQSDQGLHCPLTELLGTIECINVEHMPRWQFAHAWDESESVHFAHARKGIFAWRGPQMRSAKRKHIFLHMRPTKTEISLYILAVWSESSLSEWRHFASLVIQSLIWIFTGHTFLTLWFIRIIYYLDFMEARHCRPFFTGVTLHRIYC